MARFSVVEQPKQRRFSLAKIEENNDVYQLSPNFHKKEFNQAQQPIGLESFEVDSDLVNKLELLRKEIGDKPIQINSGYRSEEYNKRVGGVSRSQHLEGKAADIQVKGMSSEELNKAAKKVGFPFTQTYKNKPHLHVDTRKFDSKPKTPGPQSSLFDFIIPSAEAATQEQEQQFQNNPAVDFIADTISLSEAEEVKKTFTDVFNIENLKNVAKGILKGAALVGASSIEEMDAIKTTPEEAQAVLRTGLFLPSQLSRVIAPVQATIGAMIESKKPEDVAKAALRGFLLPGEVEPITRKLLPFTEAELESDNIVSLIPRAVIESIETFALFNVAFGGQISRSAKIGELKTNFKQIENAIPTLERMGVKFAPAPPIQTVAGQVNPKVLQVIGAAQKDPRVGTLLTRILATPSEVLSGVPSKFSIGNIVKAGDVTGKIVKITGPNAIISAAGKELTVPLDKLTPTEAQKQVLKPGEEPEVIPEVAEVEKTLIDEAKKFKTVDEFVESQKDKLSGAKQIVRADLNEAGFDIELTNRAIKSGMSFQEVLNFITGSVGKAKDVGVNTSNFSENLRAIIDSKDSLDIGKTTQQLTDIFNKAQKVEPTKTESLETIRQEIKTAQKDAGINRSELRDITIKETGHFSLTHPDITNEQLSKVLSEIKQPQAELPELKELSNFDNFESRQSTIPAIDKKMNEINGQRLSGSISAPEANKKVQALNKEKLEYAKEKGIAITKTASGKTRIAIRKTGFYAKKKIENAPIRDVYSQFQSPAGMSLMQDGYKRGDPFGVIYKEVWLPTKKSIADSAGLKNEFDNQFKAILKKHRFPATKKNGEYLSDMLEKKVDIPEKYVGLTKDIRKFMNDKRDEANIVRKAMGKKEIGYIENYVPHVQQTSIWNMLIGDDMTISDNFDFIIPNQAKNPFAFRRMMKEMIDPDRNFFALVERYNSAISKDIHITPAIENIKAYNIVLKDKEKFNAAKFWDEYIRVGLLGKQHKLDSALSVNPLVRRGLKKWKDLLNKAFLTGKLSWNIATQPLSFISLTPVEAGFRNTLKSVFKMFHSGIRRSVREHSLSLKIKSKDILSDAIGEGRGFANRIYRTKIDKWNDMLSVVSSIEEQLLHQASYIAGLDMAKKLGYTGDDAHIFADLVAERSQSMYNKENRSLILNSDVATGLIPFQSFAVEMSNHAKEVLTKDKGAVQLKKRERLGKLLRLIIGIWLANKYAKAITGRAKTTLGTFIPFAGEAVDRGIIELKNIIKAKKGEKQEYVSNRSIISVSQQFSNLVKASKDYMKYGDITRLRKIAITFIPAMFGAGGGGQLSNFVEGMIGVINEEVKSASGKRLFKIEDIISKIKAPIFGIWSTKGGREYWAKRTGKKTGSRWKVN